MGRKPKRGPNQLDGVLVLDKPSGPTSTKCLEIIKREFGQYKIGHAGTLDPLARGVLLVLLGQATKIAPYLTANVKTYVGELLLGQTTDTYDIQGEVTEEKPVTATADQVRDEISAWADLTEQVVPAYSAAKHKGKPLYSLARAGEDIPVKKKPVTIYDTETLDVSLPKATFRVSCSAGTYIRSLVHSLGTRMECGAIMTALNRECSKPFCLDASHSLDDILAEPESFAQRVIPLAEALPHWTRHQLTPELSDLVKNGARLPVGEVSSQNQPAQPGDQAMFLDAEGVPLALVEAKSVENDVVWVILRGLWLPGQTNKA